MPTAGATRPWWTRGDSNAFFGLGINILVNVLVADRAAASASSTCPATTCSARSCRRSASRCSLGNVYYTFLARRLARRESRDGRHRDALRPERAAHVHRRLRDHAADLPGTKDPVQAWAGRAGLGLHHRRDRADRRVRRPVHPQVHAARGDARHARRHLDHVHLDAPGRPDVGGAVDRPAGRSAIILVGFFDRPCGCRATSRSAWPRCSSAPRSAGSAATCRLAGRRSTARAGRSRSRPARRCNFDRACSTGLRGHRPAAGHRDPAGHLQLHRGHEQRESGGRGGRQLQPAQRAARRRHRRDRRLGPRLAVPARRLHRPPGLEGGRRPDRLLAGHRRRRSPLLCFLGPVRRCSWRSSRCRRSCRSCSTSAW